MMTTDAWTCTRSVAFYEADPMQVVHHSVYYKWLEDARFQYAREQLGLTYRQLTLNGELLFPIRRTTIEHYAPCWVGDEVRLSLWLAIPAIGALTFYSMIERRSGESESGEATLWERSSLAEVFCVVLDRHTNKIIEEWPAIIDQALRSAAARHPGESLLDHESIRGFSDFRKMNTRRRA